ncbi:sigma-70 family RNA polymerase sigma factor [Clostridium estertheticum]|uniref:Sigma-70 family RNA polymerase sigma factor n=1 Tax=Clostridium estertheticum TaxID=238834 RepID=A0AA47EN89_9CLOT|nr:sigma-70 family RNA polymerase sigma factor [Clostridium estertheticum]MBU3157678.1 sigma-70 family RNA polymerase sigma factor [Clostridium estertheticum]MBU3202003.1 sigma-70 family RNA polymerase sigma factor [Clostridium estertheticum]WAG63297.1 sigma-70 family RNA polymerase sigma factor [Clostridium estertheticum]WAG65205.1 sigma-70 family RNA polymerase sigma factor [Clostridium estertheticum]
MMFNKVEICGVNTSKLQELDEKQIQELLFRIQNGEYECREKFIEGNLKLVLSVITHFSNRGEKVEKLFHVGCIGLMKCIDNYDLSREDRFSTYAVSMIIEEIRRYLKDNNSIRVSEYLKDIAYKVLQVRDRLVKQDNKEPTISKIAKELELTSEDIVLALDTIQDPISLIEPTYQQDVDEIYEMDKKQDNKNLEDSFPKNILIRESMKELNAREKLIVNLRFVNGKTQMEVASEVGIAKEQVAMIEKNVLKHLRRHV